MYMCTISGNGANYNWKKTSKTLSCSISRRFRDAVAERDQASDGRIVPAAPTLARLRCPVHCGSSALVLAALPARRPLSTDRPGWYESVADSTPVHLTEQLLVSVQHATGLPWWASVICTTLAMRTVVTLPLGAYQMVIIAKVEALQAEIAELAKRLRYEVSVRAKQQGWTEKACRYHFKKNLRRIVSGLYVRDNCHPVKASLLPGPGRLHHGSAGRAGCRGRSVVSRPHSARLHLDHARVPGLVNLIIVEIFSLRRIEASKFQKYVTNFIRGISLVMIPIAATVPSSMALYWLSSSCVGLGHNLLLRSPRFRRLCRIPPTQSDSATPYRDLSAAFTAKYLK
ncbi:hypothetical protein AAFF_G00435260 [Aldrovandia affinis]|uniref:Mitochondrial inner membrane protein COX18 n=1 Tax=Aldrovandia affinis TaxID=143900 RepID=A0AAD7S8U3_9TELE|nr:hypothetical protein AAFF_G00435260 [Aldrovandia affinis]